MRTAAVGQRCLECASGGDRQRVMDMDDVRRASDRLPPITMGVLVISGGLFALGLLPGLDATIGLWLAQINPFVAQGQIWRLVTAAFLHSGFMHIAFNMYALYLFGPRLEREVGSWPFAAMYVASAIAGGAAYYVAAPEGLPAVGASGAIFGLFGVWLAAAFRGRGTALGQAQLRHLLMLLGINLVIGFLPGTRIAWQAHLGGLVAGLVIAALWMLPALRDRALLRVGAALAVGAAALLVVV